MHGLTPSPSSRSLRKVGRSFRTMRAPAVRHHTSDGLRSHEAGHRTTDLGNHLPRHLRRCANGRCSRWLWGYRSDTVGVCIAHTLAEGKTETPRTERTYNHQQSIIVWPEV